MSYQLTTIRDYLTRANHYCSDSIKGIENWYIGPNCIFKNKEQLEKYEQDNYEQDVKDWRAAFSKYCLENNILTADAKLFEEFFDFDLSPYKEDLYYDNVIEIFKKDLFSCEKCFTKFFEVCHPDMLEPVDLSPVV